MSAPASGPVRRRKTSSRRWRPAAEIAERQISLRRARPRARPRGRERAGPRRGTPRAALRSRGHRVERRARRSRAPAAAAKRSSSDSPWISPWRPAATTLPWSTMTTLSASRCTSSSSWLVRITQTPSARRPATTSRTTMRPAGSTPGGRLVQEGHAGLPDERQRQREPLLFAAGQALVRRPRDRAEPDEIDELVRVSGVLVVGGEEPDGPFGAHDRVDPAALEDDADSGRELGVIRPRVEAEDPDTCRRRRAGSPRASRRSSSCPRRWGRAAPRPRPARPRS